MEVKLLQYHKIWSFVSNTNLYTFVFPMHYANNEIKASLHDVHLKPIILVQQVMQTTMVLQQDFVIGDSYKKHVSIYFLSYHAKIGGTSPMAMMLNADNVAKMQKPCHMFFNTASR